MRVIVRCYKSAADASLYQEASWIRLDDFLAGKAYHIQYVRCGIRIMLEHAVPTWRQANLLDRPSKRY